MADLFDKTNAENEDFVAADSENEVVLAVAEGEGVPLPPDIEVVEEKKRNWREEIFDAFETFSYALVLMMLVFVFVIRFVTVDGISMNHTLEHQDKLVISDLFYKAETGDIVIIDTAGVEGLNNIPYIVKRVIATGEQRVNINFKTWAVTVDGEVLKEDYINKEYGYMIESATSGLEGAKGEADGSISFTVPKGMVFVMGDNRNHSTDSRAVGYFHEESILGRVLLRISPADKFGRVG